LQQRPRLENLLVYYDRREEELVHDSSVTPRPRSVEGKFLNNS
jgi:hypothetical protein